MPAALQLPTARIGTAWAGVAQRFTLPTLDYSPFALSQNFPSNSFADTPALLPEAASSSVTLLLDDLCNSVGSIDISSTVGSIDRCSTVGSIGTIGADMGLTLRYLRFPKTGKVRVIALGSRVALDVFVCKVRQRWLEDGPEDGLRVRWGKA